LFIGLNFRVLYIYLRNVVNKIFKVLTTALTSFGLALGFAVAPANAESTPAALVRYTETMVERSIDPTTKEV
jgi:hypothetical protein